MKAFYIGTNSTSPCSMSCVGTVLSNGASLSVCGKAWVWGDFHRSPLWVMFLFGPENEKLCHVYGEHNKLSRKQRKTIRSSIHLRLRSGSPRSQRRREVLYSVTISWWHKQRSSKPQCSGVVVACSQKVHRFGSWFFQWQL